MDASGVDVSILVPAHDVEQTLGRALRSALTTTRASHEVVCGDDVSTDGTAQVQRQVASEDARVQVLGGSNRGYGATINRALGEARGTYVAILESDDWVRPGAYDELFELACLYGMPDVVKSSYVRVLRGRDGQLEERHSHLHGRVRPRCMPFRLADAPQLIEYHPSIWSALYRRDFLLGHDIRMMEEPGGGWVDNPFCVETLAQADSIVYTDDEYYCYREYMPGSSPASATAGLGVERWHDRQDVLERLGVADRGILRANCVVGMKALDRALREWASLTPEVRAEAQRMARRMDPCLVGSIGSVAPSTRAAYERMLSLGPRPLSSVRYGLWLAGEAAWTACQDGPRALAQDVALAMGRSSERGDAVSRDQEGGM